MALSAMITAALTQTFNLLGATLAQEAIGSVKTLYLWVRERAVSPD